MLSHEHSIFRSLDLKPLALGVGHSRLELNLSADFAEGEEIQSGMLTMVLDSIMGMTVFTALQDLKPIATINLKTNYLRAAGLDERVICEATCHTIRDDVAFVNGVISSVNSKEEIATAIGAFMIGTKGREKGSRL